MFSSINIINRRVAVTTLWNSPLPSSYALLLFSFSSFPSFYSPFPTLVTAFTSVPFALSSEIGPLKSGVREDILWNRSNLEPVLILALTKIRPRTEVLACQKQAQSSH
jgi:hypothetical protein